MTKDLLRARQEMVEKHLMARGIKDKAVLAAMSLVPREQFVSESLAEHAYWDKPLPIEESQTISQPFIVACMLQAARLEPSSRALEIGTGSGYAAAVMSYLAREIHTVERHSSLARGAAQRLHKLGYHNVSVHVGDGSLGWEANAPYAAIVVAAASPRIPVALREQLEIGGNLVLPVGAQGEQRLLRLTRRAEREFIQEDLGPVMFVPLIGAQGWEEAASRRV